MRVAFAFTVVGALTASEAAASSFVVLEPMGNGPSPSIITLGEPAPIAEVKAPKPAVTARASASSSFSSATASGGYVQISPSVIVFGDPEPPVTYEMVAAIDPPKASKPRRAQFMPMVIRGGLLGDAFAAPAAKPQAAPTSPTAVASNGKSKADRNNRPSAEGTKEPAPPPPEPAPAIAAPPTRAPE